MTHRRAFLKLLGAAGAGSLGLIEGVERAFAEVSCELTIRPEDYLLDPDVTYFNHASIGTIPRVVHEAHTAYLRVCETNPWLYMWGGAWEELRETVRRSTASFVAARATELALTTNTTEGFNVLAQGLPIGRGDKVVFSSLNHPGASVCWRHQAQTRGFDVESFEFPIGAARNLTPDDVLNLYDANITPDTRVLAFPHIDNIVGMRYPVRDLARLARTKGVEFVAVDGAQSVGMIPVQLADLDLDFYAASPHKWLQAPKGLGLLYIREDLQSRLRPMRTTWGQERWADSVRIFEDYGTRNLPELVALADAVEFHEHMNFGARQEHYDSLRRYLAEGVARHPNLRWASPTDERLRSSIHALEILGEPSSQFGRRMFRDHGFVLRSFETGELNTVRISLNTMNTVEELNRFLRAA